MHTLYYPWYNRIRNYSEPKLVIYAIICEWAVCVRRAVVVQGNILTVLTQQFSQLTWLAKCYLLMSADEYVERLNGVQHLVGVRVRIALV